MADIRERHVEGTIPVSLAAIDGLTGWCYMCASDWPCDAIREADEKDAAERRASMAESLLTHARRDLGAALIRADAAETALAECRHQFLLQSDCSHSECVDREDEMRDQRDAARADAERLAEHLRNAIADLIGDWELLGGPQMRYADAEAALAAHEAQHG